MFMTFYGQIRIWNQIRKIWLDLTKRLGSGSATLLVGLLYLYMYESSWESRTCLPPRVPMRATEKVRLVDLCKYESNGEGTRRTYLPPQVLITSTYESNREDRILFISTMNKLWLVYLHKYESNREGRTRLILTTMRATEKVPWDLVFFYKYSIRATEKVGLNYFFKQCCGAGDFLFGWSWSCEKRAGSSSSSVQR